MSNKALVESIVNVYHAKDRTLVEAMLRDTRIHKILERLIVAYRPVAGREELLQTGVAQAQHLFVQKAQDAYISA